LEIEAKFSIPNKQVFRQLMEASQLAGFRLGTGTTEHLHDRYLDTAGGALQARGYACRLRRTGRRYEACLKGLGQASGPIHCREEHTVALPEALAPLDWPPGLVRDLTLRACAGAPLLPIVDLKQIRHCRPLLAEERPLIHLSLEQVCVFQDDRVLDSYQELEAELVQGSEQELERIALAIEQTWGLKPQTLSKFERALITVGHDAPPQQEAT
jgi:inorganic triphosphatase YgiF